MIDYTRDYTYDYFGIKTLQKCYLLRKNGEILERPQQLIMRVAIGVYLDDLSKVNEMYTYMS